jgi:hypothetical protein
VCRGRNGELRDTTRSYVSMLNSIPFIDFRVVLTLSITFSSELGQSIAKQTNNKSVSGYESGRRRSYSS